MTQKWYFLSWPCHINRFIGIKKGTSPSRKPIGRLTGGKTPSSLSIKDPVRHCTVLTYSKQVAPCQAFFVWPVPVSCRQSQGIPKRLAKTFGQNVWPERPTRTTPERRMIMLLPPCGAGRRVFREGSTTPKSGDHTLRTQVAPGRDCPNLAKL